MFEKNKNNIIRDSIMVPICVGHWGHIQQSIDFIERLTIFINLLSSPKKLFK